MKNVNRLLLVFVMLVTTSCMDLAKIVPNYYAKEMCSCLFVMDQSEEYCREINLQDPEPKSIKIDYKNKTVRTRFLIFKEKAFWISDEEGCQIK